MKDKIEKASKRHCWSRQSHAEAFEAGFVSGAEFMRAEIGEEIQLLHSYFTEEYPRENAEEIFNTVKESLKRLM